jgi:hypothetical protein
MSKSAAKQNVNNVNNIEVDPELMKYVLGKDKENLNALRQTYPDIRIAANYNTVFISSPSDISQCVMAVNMLIDSAVVIKQDMDYKRRVNKEKEARRRAIQAANRLRENIEAELQRNQSSSVNNTTAVDNSNSEIINQNLKKNNKFAGLDIED